MRATFLLLLACAAACRSSAPEASVEVAATPVVSLPETAWLHPDGQQGDLSLAGKWVLVEFFQPNCIPCRKHAPHLARLNKDFEHLGLQVVGLTHADPEGAQTFARENQVNYPVLPNATKSFGDFGVYVVPSYKLINPRGQIVADERELGPYFPSVAVIERKIREHR